MVDQELRILSMNNKALFEWIFSSVYPIVFHVHMPSYPVKLV